MPDTVASLYEQLFPLTTVMKQRMVETFSGDSLDGRWTTENFGGTGTFVMQDEIDGGYKIMTEATDTTAVAIHFNNIRQYAHNASEIITVYEPIHTTLITVDVGFANDVSNVTALDMAVARIDETSSFFQLATADNSTSTQTDSSISASAGYKTHKVACGSSNVIYYLAGVSEVTKTTNLPTLKMQPYFFCRTESNGARQPRILYCEAYNT